MLNLKANNIALMKEFKSSSSEDRKIVPSNFCILFPESLKWSISPSSSDISQKFEKSLKFSISAILLLYSSARVSSIDLLTLLKC